MFTPHCACLTVNIQLSTATQDILFIYCQCVAAQKCLCERQNRGMERGSEGQDIPFDFSGASSPLLQMFTLCLRVWEFYCIIYTIIFSITHLMLIILFEFIKCCTSVSGRHIPKLPSTNKTLTVCACMHVCVYVCDISSWSHTASMWPFSSVI